MPKHYYPGAGHQRQSCERCSPMPYPTGCPEANGPASARPEQGWTDARRAGSNSRVVPQGRNPLRHRQSLLPPTALLVCVVNPSSAVVHGGSALSSPIDPEKRIHHPAIRICCRSHSRPTFAQGGEAGASHEATGCLRPGPSPSGISLSASWQKKLTDCSSGMHENYRRLRWII